MKILRFVGTASLISIVGYSLFFAGFFTTWRDLERLAKHGLRTDGIVVGKELNNHASIHYEYWVSGSKYSGLSPSAMNGLPTFSNVHIGDTITVTYRPDKPSESFGGYRADAYASMSNLFYYLVPTICIILGISNALLFHLRQGRKSQMRSRSIKAQVAS